MKISEMINALQKKLNEHGDLELWYAKDDEGNGYQRVIYEPSLMFKLSHESELRGIESLEECIQEHIEDYPDGVNDKDYKPLNSNSVICIN